MEQPTEKNCDFFALLKSWIPWKTDSSNVSKDFWMPDNACIVCYDCDTLFTVFNRRHHCRLCGRIFCGKCTANWVPANIDDSNYLKDESEKVRACNFCFKQREQVLARVKNEIKDGNSSKSTSSSAYGSTISICSMSFNLCDHISENISISPYQSAVMDLSGDSEGGEGSRKSNISVTYVDDSSVNQFRSEEDDGEAYGIYQLDSKSKSSQSNEYFDPIDYNAIQSPNESHNFFPGIEIPDAKDLNSYTFQESYETPPVDELQLVNKEEDAQNIDVEVECEEAEDVNYEPVDFENNRLLWIPPEPENEEDDRESPLFDDDEDSCGTGVWGPLLRSSSFGSNSDNGKEKSGGEEPKNRKNIVDCHFRALVSNLLHVENIPVKDDEDDDVSESWLEIITSLSWEAASLLKPDTSRSGGMDPGGYVKVKCLANGRRSESVVIKGIVCKKNVAHRRMTSRIEKPRVMILGGALEYQRVSNLLSSFDTLLQQEMDHLKMAVAKIDAHHPNVLLVEKSVSRYAQEYILAKDISLVLNIKKSLLERIARCTGAQIVTSIDHLSAQMMGYCDLFHVEKCLESHGSAGQAGKQLTKTLMYFEDCPKPLGCTILLRGANGDELKKIKHVVQYGIFAAYHLALETSFLADEGATLPDHLYNESITVSFPNKSVSINQSISMVPGLSFHTGNNQENFENPIITNTLTIASSNAPDNQDPIPLEPSPSLTIGDYFEPLQFTEENSTPNDSERPDEPGSSKEELPPPLSNSPSILVSLSSRCIKKGIVCERSHLFRIKYYGSFDKPLGRFLQDNLFDQGVTCRSCDLPSEAHVKCYTHRQGTLTISVKKLPEILLVGESEGKIWMWHRCLRCPRTDGFPPTTKRIVMSDAAWGLSFGKFLELSFSNHASASRVVTCGHSLHRDCLRFYGCGNMVACFRYASIDVFSVYLPPSKVDFDSEIQDWIQNEADEAVKRADVLFSEVRIAISQISHKRTSSEPRHHVSELVGVLRNEVAEYEELLKRSIGRQVKKGHPPPDILEINRLRRQLLFQSYMWDHRLVYAASLDDNNSQLSNSDEKTIPSINFSGPRIITKNSNSVTPDETPAMDSKTSPIPAPLENRSNVRRTVSDGQFKTHPEAEKSKDNNFSLTGSISVDSSLAAVAEKLALDTRVDERVTSPIPPSPIPSVTSKGIENAEDTKSWLGIPFVNFYRSFNKNFLGTPQKLDTFSGYKPVYVSPVKDSGPGPKWLLPEGVSEIVIPVYDDEPTSIISYALISQEYHIQLYEDGERPKESAIDSSFSLPSNESTSFQHFRSFDDSVSEVYRSFSIDESVLTTKSDSIPSTKPSHIRVSFTDDGKVKYGVTCYFAKHFDALRRICCPSELDYVRSLSRCKKWGAQGGKSNVFFAKTLDDRFIIKQVTKTELESFIEFAPEYFKYLMEAISTKSPTCLAKILGIYQVTIQNPRGKESKMDVLVMENLLFKRKVSRLYDLKGSCRSRYNPDSSGSNKVLLDQNLIEAMPTSPLFVGNKAKRLLERAVWNDTSFLASVNVMDYSLLVGVDEENDELVLGIIDFMRQYTWDKHLETWVKASGILGGSKNVSPTVISPKQYKKRFRKAMTTYFLMVPDQWSPPNVLSSDA